MPSIALAVVLAFFFGYALTIGHVLSLLFWGSLAFSLLVAFVVTFPVNRWLIARGLGHAAVHSGHH